MSIYDNSKAFKKSITDNNLQSKIVNNQNMIQAIDNFITVNRHMRGTWAMTESLREFVSNSKFNYFNACDYIVNNHGYSL